LTYPNIELKCELNKAKKNVNTKIKCKTQEEFKYVESVVVESKVIKKKNQELFYIQGKTFDLDKKYSCEKYNKIKKQIIEERQKNGISYALMAKLELVNQVIQFFMALARKTLDDIFQQTYKFKSFFTFSNRRNLRNLDEDTTEVDITCNLDSNLKLDFTAGYNCKSDEANYQGTPLSLQIDDEGVKEISLIEKANFNVSDASMNIIDFSDKSNLEKLNSLPVITINNINGDSCSENGQYTITGKCPENSNIKDTYSDVEIYFSLPESTGLCDVNKNKNEIVMTCKNREKFAISQIMLDRNFVQDSEGNYIFIIDTYTSPEQFACDINPDSIKPANETMNPSPSSSEPSSSDNEAKDRHSFHKKSSGGLKGGAIVGIIIGCIVAVAAVVVIITLMRKGILSFGRRKKPDEPSSMVYIENDKN